jgi:hypothetical protein
VQLIMQLGMDQMHLTQVGLVWVARYPRACLTVTPMCESPSTPRPTKSRMLP